MQYPSFYHNYFEFKKSGDRAMAKDVLLSEIADAIALKKEEVIDKLNHSGIPTDSSVSEAEVADIVVENLSNKKLISGLASIVAKKTGEYETFLSFNEVKSPSGDLGVGAGVRSKSKKAIKPTDPQDFTIDIAREFYSGIDASDKPTLKEKVENLRKEFGVEIKESVNGWKVLLLLGLGAVALYVITLPEKKAVANK